MNEKTVIQNIIERLNDLGFKVVLDYAKVPTLELQNLPCASLKEVNFSVKKIDNNSYQTVTYEVILLEIEDKEQDSAEKLRTVVVDLLRLLFSGEVTTQVDLSELVVERYRYTLNNDISLKAKFKVTSIYIGGF